MSQKNDNVSKDLIVGMIIYGIIIQAVLLLLSSPIYNSVGLWIGVAVGIGMSIHMKRSIENGLDLIVEKDVQKYMIKQFGIRFFAVTMVLIGVMYFRIGNYITAFLGLMGLKVSALMQPHVHRLLEKLNK